jgi:hypothetical protein
VIPIPAGIGVATSGCVYALHTTAPTGVIRVGSEGATLGALFRVWGQALGQKRLLSFRSTAGVRVFVGGVERHGDPRAVRLTRHAQIVLEIRGYVPPHPFYVFPRSAP